jgi:hypothetical protein
MKKIFFLLIAALMCNAASAITMPRHIYVAGQNGKEVVVHNCITRETKTVHGYLRNIGVDNSGNVYILVCNTENGWGNYYVYKNCNPQIYLSLVEDQGGIYSSAAMRVKGNDVIVAGVQSKGFNNKGYQSRMMGYVNGQRLFITGYDRKSLKYDNFGGYQKVIGKSLQGYGQENNSGNPQGDYLSCVYHVDDVDYSGGAIYTTGWGEREYSDKIGTTKYYLVRRCPRVWKNGAEVVAQYENRTGAAWNIYVFNQGGKEYIYTSGHQRSQACAWEHNVDQFKNNYSPYPGVLGEATFAAGMSDNVPRFGRAFLCSRNVGLSMIELIFMENNKQIHTRSWGQNADVSDIVAGKDGFYIVQTDHTNTKEVHCWKKCNGISFAEEGFVCRLPGDVKLTNPKLAVCE